MGDFNPGSDVNRLAATVAEWRRKADANPDNLYPGFADALVDFAAALAGEDKSVEALVPAAEAVRQYRLLDEVEPQTYRVHLASALNNLSNRLVETGRNEDADRAGSEAIALAQACAAENMEQARFVLVSALINQAGRSMRDADPEGAVAALGAAVETFVAAGEDGAPFLGTMIDTLHRVAMALMEAGLWGETVAVRRLTQALFGDAAPPAVNHLLALTLTQAALAFARGGRAADALLHVDEGAVIARRLYDANPDQYGLFLAQTLGNLAGRLHETGDSQSGLEVALEAVSLFQQAAASDPAQALPSLILTLESLEAILAALGMGDQVAVITAQREQLKETLVSITSDAKG